MTLQKKSKKKTIRTTGQMFFFILGGGPRRTKKEWREHRRYWARWTHLYNSQNQWIKRHFGEEAAATANYGWGATGTGAATKVYGHGVLETEWTKSGRLKHTFTEF